MMMVYLRRRCAAVASAAANFCWSLRQLHHHVPPAAATPSSSSSSASSSFSGEDTAALERGLRIAYLVPPVWVPFDEWVAALFNLSPETRRELSSSAVNASQQLTRARFRAAMAAAVMRLSHYPTRACRLLSVSGPQAARPHAELALPTFLRSNVSPTRQRKNPNFGVLAAEAVNPVVPLVVLHCYYPRPLATEVRHHLASIIIKKSSSQKSATTTIAAGEIASVLPKTTLQEITWKLASSQRSDDATRSAMGKLMRSFPEFFIEVEVGSSVSEWTLTTESQQYSTSRLGRQMTREMRSALETAVTKCLGSGHDVSASKLPSATPLSPTPQQQQSLQQVFRSVVASSHTEQDSNHALEDAIAFLCDPHDDANNSNSSALASETFLTCILEMGSVVAREAHDGIFVCSAAAAASVMPSRIIPVEQHHRDVGGPTTAVPPPVQSVMQLQSVATPPRSANQPSTGQQSTVSTSDAHHHDKAQEKSKSSLGAESKATSSPPPPPAAAKTATGRKLSVLAASFGAHPDLLLRLVWAVTPRTTNTDGVSVTALVAQLPEGARTVLHNEGAIKYLTRHRDVFRVCGFGDQIRVHRRNDSPPPAKTLP